MKATWQKSIVVCTVMALTVSVACADSVIPANTTSKSSPACSSKIHINKSITLLPVDFKQDVYDSNIKEWLASDSIKIENKLEPSAVSLINNINSSRVDANIKSLPAAPGAVIMGIIGFLIVTLVRDRKFWMTVFVGIIVIGQVGVLSVPKIAALLTQNKQQTASLLTCNFLALRVENVIASNSEAIINYIGLLRRLAGSPEDTSHRLDNKMCSYVAHFSPIIDLKGSNYLTYWNSTSISANVDGDNCYSDLTDHVCQLRRYSPSDIYSAAFAFPCLPRGPPPC